MKLSNTVASLACALGAFVLVGGATFTVASAQSDPVIEGDAVPYQKLPDWKVNGQGETFGALPYDPRNEESPDLIYVSLEEGGEGFVRSADLLPLILGPEFNSPEEAAAWSRQMDAMEKSRGSSIHPLAVYDKEGRATGQIWNGVNSTE